MRLTKYDPGIHVPLCEYMSRVPLTLAQMAVILGVTDRTLDNWCAKYPELKAAIKPGKDFIDNLVISSQYKRALGYDVVEWTKERVPVGYENDNPVKWAMKITKKVKRHIPGDVAAQCFWLKNRQGWRDVTNIEHSGSLDLFAMSSDERKERIVELLNKRTAELAGKN